MGSVKCGIVVGDGATLELIRKTPLAKQYSGRLTSSSFRAPGDTLDGFGSGDNFLRGHGVQFVQGRLTSHMCGILEQVDRLLRVRPLHIRFAPATGDVVIGRVTDVAKGHWKLDISSRLSGNLHLSSVDLPGREQRRRTAMDEMNMRNLYGELIFSFLFTARTSMTAHDTEGQNDLISAEVQSSQLGASTVLHTRNLKYGCLSQGQLISITPALVKRVHQHFYRFPQVTGGTTVEFVLARNGLIFVGARAVVNAGNIAKDDTGCCSSALSRLLREYICRISNTVRVFALLSLSINPHIIWEMSEKSVDWGFEPKEILTSTFQKLVLTKYVEINYEGNNK
mmetsp:Transcript_10859/g.47031  ORF Transcript_10859/g.47031 Transcript_10859/m.47031 type:complete len:339 (+) Transcript_10859:68-1084(+)